MALLLGAASLHATPLNLSSVTPDFFNMFATVSYAPGGGSSLLIDGMGLSFDDGITIHNVSSGAFDLDAEVDGSGNLTFGANSALTITGTTSALGFNSGTLLTGNLTAFGFPLIVAAPLEFTFNVTGGDAAGLFGGTGGIIVSGNTGFAGTFSAPFGSSMAFQAFSDTFVTPEPSSTFLIGIGLGLLAIVRRREQRERQS